MKTKLKSILAVALCAVGLAAFAEPAAVAQFVKGGEVVAEFGAAAAAVAALDDAQYADIEEFRIGLAADTVFDFGGRTNRVVIGNVGNVENTLKNVLLDCAGDCAVTGMVGTVVFGEGVRIEKETGFKQGWVDLIIKGGLYKSDPSGYCEGGYFGARRGDASPSLNGLYAILPEAEIAVTVSKRLVTTHYATLQDAFNLIGENEEVTLRLFNNLELGTAVTKLEGNKFIHLLPSESGANTITRVGAEPVIEIGREAKLEISNVVFDGANVTSENPMIEVAGKTGTKFGWLIAGDGFVVSNAVGGAVHVGNGGKFELDGVAKIFENFTGGKPKNVIIEDSAAIQLTACGAVTDGNYAQIGVYSDNDKFMIPGGQFGAVALSYEYATDFADGDISVAKPWVGFINDRDGTLHHAAGAKIAAAGKKTYKRWVGGEYKVTLEEGDHLVSRVSTHPTAPGYLPELIWTARQEAPAAQPAPAVLDWTDTTLTLAVSNGCDYALVTSGSAETNWVSMVGTDNTYALARPAGDLVCLRRYSITPSNIVSSATAYSVRIPAGTEGDPWLVGAENPEDVTAWTNGNEFVVSGDGTVSDLSKLASKVTVEKLTIKDATVTVAESEAFNGFNDVSLTLPDGWQGKLPDEDGNWYGATVNLMRIPLAVKNVRARQRWPWNGKVDVLCDMTGPAGAKDAIVTVKDGEKALTNFTAEVTIPEDGVLATNLVWDAATAGLAANFKSDDVTVEVAIAEPDIAAKSAAGTVDLRTAVALAEGAATVPTDADGFDTTAENVAPYYSTTFVPGDYCVVDLTTGKVTEMKDVASAATFNTDEYKTTKMAFRYVPAGKFKANCANTTSIKSLVSNDVALSAYWIAVFPVTEAQYNAVMGGETTSVKPKESILWDSFRGGDWTGWDGTYANVPAPGDGTFVKALNDKVAAAGCADMFDLCTSFQWERAARAGTRTDYFFSDKTAAEFGSDDDFPDLWNYAWFAKNFPSIGVQNVGGKLPNAWGLYDVYGNAYEQCLDWHEGNSGLVKDKSLEDYAGASSNSYSNRVVRGGHYTSDAGKCSSVFRTYQKTSIVMDAGGFRLIRKPATSSDPSVVPAISAKSAKFTVDLRGEIALAKGEVTVAGVSYSDTAWGEATEANVTLRYTNETTGATGVLKTGLSGEDVTEVDLPEKDGDYRLTHSTGDLTSFVTFTVSGYPLGSEGNPWEIGANAAADVIAFSNGTSTVSFKPVRGTVTKAGLETITSAMGRADFPAKLIAADGGETYDLAMVLGASGTAYGTIAEALAANEASYTLFETAGYFVSYSGGEGALGTMATDTFIPTVPTNLTANAYWIVGYDFTGWSKDGATVAYTNRQEGVDFAQPGETLALTALWEHVGVEPTDYNDLAAKLPQVTRPVRFDLVRDIEIPAGGKIVVPAGKSVTFDGIGKFDVTAERPALFNGITVGTGLKPGDLGRFVTDKDVKAYYEDGKVIVRGRGETEEFPWLLGTAGHEDEVTAWAGDGMILTKPTRGTASVAALQSVTNALGGYVPGPGELKVISADGTATNDVVMLLGSDGVPYDTLAEVFAADPRPETVRLFEVKGANVEFNAMGGKYVAGDSEVVTNFCILAYTMPETPTRADYTFLGWYDSWKDGAAVVTNGQDLISYEAHSIYAKWKSAKFEPSDDEEVIKTDGNGVIVAQDVEPTGELVLPEMNHGGAGGVANVEIGDDAFLKNTGITSVSLPVFVKKIGAYAFANATGISKINFVQPRDATTGKNTTLTIGDGAFSGLSLTKIELPPYVASIGAKAFAGNTKLTDLTIMGPTTIDWAARPFLNCGTASPNGKVTLHLAYEVATDKTYATKLWNYVKEYAQNIVIDFNPYGTAKVLNCGTNFVEFEAKIDTPWPKVNENSVKVLTTTELTGADLEKTWTTVPLTGVTLVEGNVYRATFANQGEGKRFYQVAIVMPAEEN